MVENTTVSALCARIYESVIEACIFEVGDHLYIGDWDTSEFDTCGDTTSSFYTGLGMFTVEVGALLLRVREESFYFLQTNETHANATLFPRPPWRSVSLSFPSSLIR